MSKNSLVFFACIILFACTDSKQEKHTLQTKNASAEKVNQAAIDSLQHILQDGDLVFRRGADAISDLFSNCNLQDKSFSHCGIYLVKNDTGFVYHSIGGTYNPGGKLRKDVVTKFIESDSNSGFGAYRLVGISTRINNLHKVIDSHYALPIKFDANFDLETDSLQYCAEFVAKSVHAAFKDSIFGTTTIAAKKIVCIDNIFLAKAVRPIYKFTYAR
jgi:Permuted papain-like amidase enzyme, YaeF/YiiX, C92 family